MSGPLSFLQFLNYLAYAPKSARYFFTGDAKVVTGLVLNEANKWDLPQIRERFIYDPEV